MVDCVFHLKRVVRERRYLERELKLGLADAKEMKMRRLISSVLLIGLLLPACSGDEPEGNHQGSSVEASAGGDSLPGTDAQAGSLLDAGCQCPLGYEQCLCSDGPSHQGGGQNSGPNEKGGNKSEAPDFGGCCCCPSGS